MPSYNNGFVILSKETIKMEETAETAEIVETSLLSTVSFGNISAPNISTPNISTSINITPTNNTVCNFDKCNLKVDFYNFQIFWLEFLNQFY